ncbi:MAG: outer membrane beta-barrel protein [Prevotellaceae bacterium]|nr:outer membrane beta-barrel protein [Prevotellaceae bacterium]
MTFFILVLLLWSTSLAAASKYGHEVLGGINMLASTLAPVSSQDNRLGIGFGGGLGYILRFNESMGIRTGIHANYYRSTTAMGGDITETSDVYFPDNWGWYSGAPVEGIPDYFQFKTRLSEYRAEQSALYMQVPLLFEYAMLFPNSYYLGWYGSVGFKLGYAATGSSSVSFSGFKTSAVMVYESNPDDPIEIDDMPSLGWGISDESSGNALNATSKLQLGFSALAYFELGFSQQLTTKHTLYAGVFGEYNLYGAVGSVSNVMVEYVPINKSFDQDVGGNYFQEGERPYYFRYHPAANVSGNRVKSTHLLSFGITVRIGLALNGSFFRRNDRLFNVHYFQY